LMAMRNDAPIEKVYLDVVSFCEGACAW
jgi:hypothetical protein